MGAVRPVSFGLNGLDRKLLKYVHHRRGVFVEAGANDGISQSNTAYFEFYLGWSGLLVEPIPELAAICRANRPNSTVEECALVAVDDPASAVQMTYCNLMSVVCGARGSTAADHAHVTAGRRYLAPGDEVRSLTVPTAKLGELLAHNEIECVDLLCLDVEGMEAQVLRGLNFDKVSPRWILVEANDPVAIDAVLGKRYRFVAHLSHHDRLYRSIV